MLEWLPQSTTSSLYSLSAGQCKVNDLDAPILPAIVTCHAEITVQGRKVERERLIHLVRDALANYYDPVHLQTHRLGRELSLPSGGETAAEALRKALWDAVESLRPGGDVPQASAAWLNYRLLWLYYIQGQGRDAACQELGLSQRSFYRRLSDAVDAVASVLLARGQVAAPAIVEDAGDAITRAAAQAIARARESMVGLVDLGAVVQDAVSTIEPLAAQLGRSVRVDCPSTMPRVQGDAGLYHQAILNLLAAVLRSEGRGAVRLHGSLTDTAIRFRLTGFGADGGKDQVMALDGVMLSTRLLDAFGGELGTEWGRDGLALWFTLPKLALGSILVVDDDQDTIDLYRRFLQAHGYVVAGAHSSEDVARRLEARCPDVILLDVLMPGQDGWKMMQRLREDERTAEVPIVICSVLAQPRLALALGASEVLKKPVTEQDLLRTIQRVVDIRDRAHRAGPAGT